MTKTLREMFVEKFGEEQTAKVEAAAEMHDFAYRSEEQNKGSDAFRWVLVWVIGFECVSKPNYAKWHGIEIDPEQFRQWVYEHAELEKHNGAWDNMAMVSGAYKGFIKPEKLDELKDDVTIIDVLRDMANTMTMISNNINNIK